MVYIVAEIVTKHIKQQVNFAFLCITPCFSSAIGRRYGLSEICTRLLVFTGARLKSNHQPVENQPSIPPDQQKYLRGICNAWLACPAASSFTHYAAENSAPGRMTLPFTP